MPEYIREAAENLLRQPGHLNWNIIPILLVVIYIYNYHVGKKNWSVVFGGLALWGMDWFNEIWNALVFHFTEFAPVWGTPNESSFIILIGLNIEITLMFLMMGPATLVALPKDKKMKILGINNRIIFIAAFAALAVIVEIFLNLLGALTWEYSWWSVRNPWLIWLIGYVPFFVAAVLIHDMESTKKQAIATGAILGFDGLLLIIFGCLGWI